MFPVRLRRWVAVGQKHIFPPMPEPFVTPGTYGWKATIHIPLGSHHPDGRLSWWSMANIGNPKPHCLRFDMHWMVCARCLAADKAGNNKAARMAMMAITTSNSISVKPDGNCERLFDLDCFKLGIGIGCE